jgi:hypothetical protein
MTHPVTPLVEVAAPNGTKSLLAAFSVARADAVATVKKVIPFTYTAELSFSTRAARLEIWWCPSGRHHLDQAFPRGVRPPRVVVQPWNHEKENRDSKEKARKARHRQGRAGRRPHASAAAEGPGCLDCAARAAVSVAA